MHIQGGGGRELGVVVMAVVGPSQELQVQTITVDQVTAFQTCQTTKYRPSDIPQRKDGEEALNWLCVLRDDETNPQEILLQGLGPVLRVILNVCLLIIVLSWNLGSHSGCWVPGLLSSVLGQHTSPIPKASHNPQSVCSGFWAICQ